MNRLTHGPGCEKTPTIWAILIGETLIKPYMSKANWLCVEKNKHQEEAKLLLSDSMIKTSIDELASNIECQVFKNNKHQFFFCSIHCD